MSRLIVKNLPAYLDEARLKAHFASRNNNEASLTDVKIVRRPDGTSRRFGFVGFRSDVDAQHAQQYFDKTFIDTSRIAVITAKAINDEGLKAERDARKADKQRVQQQHQDNVVRSNAISKKGEEPVAKKAVGKKKAITFEEFMNVMKPKSKRKAWSNEETADADAALDPTIFQEDQGRSILEPQKKKVKQDPDVKSANTEVDEPRGLDEDAAAAAAAAAAQNAVVNDEGMTDLDYMYKRMKRNVGTELEEEEANAKKYDQSDEEDSGKTEQAHPSDQQNEKESRAEETVEEDENEKRRQERKKKALEEKARRDEADADLIMSNGRLFVRNLPFEAAEEELEGYFSRFGELTQAHITTDKNTKKSKGIAFVTFADPAHALAAFRSADGHTFQGRLLHILPAVQQNAAPEAKNVKDVKRQSLKANAGKDFNWSTLYMSADAVASSVAARLGIDKADILNPQRQEGGEEQSNKSMSPSVRLALAETSVINETRDFLAAEGVNVDAFEAQQGRGRRSDTIILVKNIPFGTSTETLHALFGRHGSVERVVMPPSGTIAIVEMQVVGEAKVAFKSLAYKRLGNSVLYLEKAPIGIMKDTAQRAKTSTDAASIEAEKSAGEATTTSSTVRSDAFANADTDVAVTLFVKNLSFSTTDERLTMAFTRFSDFMFARVQKRNVQKRGDGSSNIKLSMGYAFIGFRSMDGARTAQKAMDKTTLDGHLLSVAFARRGHDADDQEQSTARSDSANPSDMRQAPSSKLIVKNLAFQATKKDVRSLFAAYGKLKSVRVPRKGMANAGGAASGVRGFGFVEFVNRTEALHAYRALRHSHLLGRHLVLEWDTEGGTEGGGAVVGQEESEAVKRLRQRAAQNVAASSAATGGAAHKREKLHLNEDDIRQAARDEQRQRAENDDDDDDEGDED